MKKALLLSASSYKDSGYLNHCKGWIKEFLGRLWEDEILFIPFAGVRRTNEQYEQKVAECLESNNIRSIHRFSDMKAAVKNAKPFPTPDYPFADIVGTGGDGANTILRAAK